MARLTSRPRILGVPVHLGISGFAIPLAAFANITRLPETIRFDGGTISGGRVALAIVAAVTALYIHESGHVVAARAVGLPIREVDLTSLLPAVTSDVTVDDDPRRIMWFAAGGPIADLLGLTLATGLAFIGPTQPVRAIFAGYAAGAAIQLLNALPSTVGGGLLIIVAICLPRTQVSVGVSVVLGLIGAALLIVRFAASGARSDGDIFLEARRRLRPEKKSRPTPP